MLVYSRVDAANLKDSNSSQKEDAHRATNGVSVRPFVPPTPPAKALEVVRTLNTEHDDACKKFIAR